MEHYQMVVGGEDCPLKTIVSTLQKSPVIRDDWSAFARQLDVPNAHIKRLRQDLLLSKITHEDLIFEVVEMWIGENASKATLAGLLQVVEGSCGANDAGELLRLEYKLPCKVADGNPSIKWKCLSPAFQNRVIGTFQYFTPNLKFTDILPKLTGAALVSLMRGKKPNILSLPEELSYYVSRKMVTRNIISPEIFDQNSSDIFLFIGVDRYELSKLAKDRITSRSGEQLENMLNVKFIVLDQQSHFDKICRKTNHPVHLLRREEDGKLRWMKSNGEMSYLRKYIDQEQDELDEGQLCQICDSQTLPVLICDTPGMGKSVLLAQIGHRLVQLYPDRTVLFIELSEFIKIAKSFGVEDKLKMIELTLQEWTGEPLPQSKLNLDEETILIELLLDGFDEVDSADQSLTLEILQTITNSFKSIRLWFTSRPHLMDALEIYLNILAHNIRPFSEETQVSFLSSFWSRKVDLDQKKVELFAKQCLISLKAKLNSTDNDIAGIPLQCLLIGEVYQDDAMEYAKVGNKNAPSAPPEIQIGTITHLYRQLVKIKLQKYKSRNANKLSEEELMTIHSHLSLQLLFPDSHGFLGLTKVGEVDIEDVRKAGILTSIRSGELSFTHRTFAEYFVAWFVFDKLQQAEGWRPELVDLFFMILGCSRFENQTKFEHPVICYFLNSMIADLQIDTLPNHFPSEFDGRLLPLIEMIVCACVEDNFPQIFKLFEERHTFDKLSGTLFNVDLLLLAIRNSSVGLVHSVLTHFERPHNFDLEVKKATLREAVKNGKFSILEFFIKERRLRSVVENWDENSNLVYDCLDETEYCSDGEINERIQVLQMLVDIKGSLMNHANGIGVNERTASRFSSNSNLESSSAMPPLLCRRAHVRLLIKLIRLGADVFVQNEDGDTVLHLRYSKDYHKLLKIISTNDLRKLVHVESSWGNTPLMSNLERFDPLPETLDTFHGAGADFNPRNKSILETAVKCGRNADTIRKLVQLGAQKVELLHHAVDRENVEAIGVLLDECKNNLHALDEEGRTPLDLAIHKVIFPRSTYGKEKRLEICLKLFKRGGKFKKVVNSLGDSLLHLAATNNFESVRLLIQFGVDVNKINKDGNTPLHAVSGYPQGTYHNARHTRSNLGYPHRSHDPFDRSPIVQYLLENGSNPRALNKRKETPFHAFLKNQNGDFETFRLFKSIWDERSLWTPTMGTLALVYAVGREDAFLDKEFESLARECEAHRADFNWKDGDGNSLLHLAASNGKTSTMKFLLRKGLDLNSKNNRGQSPLEKVLSSKNTSLEVIRCLIENGADPTDIAEFWTKNILHTAAFGKTDTLKYFLEWGGLDVNGRGPGGHTPLHKAVAYNIDGMDCIEKCSLLIQYGADVNIVNSSGYTPQDMAMMYKSRNQDKRLIELLLPKSTLYR